MLFVVPRITHRMASWGSKEGSAKSRDHRVAPRRTEKERHSSPPILRTRLRRGTHTPLHRAGERTARIVEFSPRIGTHEAGMCVAYRELGTIIRIELIPA
jgi:hypothetical protein